jgi:hypothetical protein
MKKGAWENPLADRGKSAMVHASAMKSAFPEPEIITRRGKPVSVVLPLKRYQELLERVEDAADLAWLKKARKKPQSYRPLEAYLADRGGR